MATNDREQQLLRDAYAAGITDRRELANFMAQVGHESGGLSRLEESFRYTKGSWQISANVQSALRQGPEALEAARLEALGGRPERLAELMYGGRMGNDDPGDGYRYRGRGYIQLTGKDQYEAAGEALDLDLVRQPELAAQPENAARIATWYWQQNVPEATRDDARAAGAAINGRNPPNGLADREQRFERWERDITPELMQNLANGRLGEPVQAPARGNDGQPAATQTAEAAATRSGSFEQTMQVMLPPQGGTSPHITGHYGEHRGHRNHGGTDFNYVGGQTGINREHPTVHSPVSGTVTFSGGDFGTVKIRDAQGNSHEILHLQGRQVTAGQTIAAGDPIGTMGGRGPEGANQYAQHVHYQLRDPNGTIISPERFWNEGRAQEAGGGGRPQSNAGVLREDSRGDAVRGMQEKLEALGIRDARGQPLQPDGVFGQRTDEAVRAFQQANGLKVDGLVGPATHAALDSALERSRTAATPQQGDAAADKPEKASLLDDLLRAARNQDGNGFKDALSRFSDGPLGQAFQSQQGERAAETARSADAQRQQDAQSQDGAR